VRRSIPAAGPGAATRHVRQLEGDPHVKHPSPDAAQGALIDDAEEDGPKGTPLARSETCLKHKVLAGNVTAVRHGEPGAVVKVRQELEQLVADPRGAAEGAAVHPALPLNGLRDDRLGEPQGLQVHDEIRLRADPGPEGKLAAHGVERLGKVDVEPHVAR